MNKHTITETNVQPVKQTYTADKNIDINERKIKTQGLSMYLNDICESPTDVKTNNHSLLTLTNKKYTKHLFRLDLPNSGDIYPYVFTTYMLFTNSAIGYFNLSDAKTDSKTWKYPGTGERVFYLTIEELASDTTTTRQYQISNEEIYTPIVRYTDVPNTRLFQIELLDDKYCRIYHDDSYVKTCLTYPDLSDTNATCTFEQFVPTESYSGLDKQVFNYTYDTNSGYLILRKEISGARTIWITQQGTLNGEALENTKLKGELVTPGDGVTWLPKAMIRVRINALKNVSSNIARSVDTAWYRYNSGIIEQNSVEIDDTTERIYPETNAKYYTNSYQYLQNNYLASAQYYNITDNELSVNLIPLKNQLTPEGDQPENSPHATGDIGEFCLDFVSRKNTDFRTYHKINAGTNQITGDDKMHLGYTSYTDKILLKSDQITYFHMPDIMKPFTWMNVNYRRVSEYPTVYPLPKMPVAAPNTFDYEFEDFVGLIRAGAIAGNSPVNSDKIFKKRANYRYYTPWGDAGQKGNKGGEGDSHFGTWLCSWLMAVPGDDKYEKKYGPMWMDRYYDDKKFSEVQIMEKEPNCFDSLVDAMDALRDDVSNAKSYFDIPSQLRLERGVQYAYYHIGNNENKKIIDSFSKFIEQEDVSTYTKSVSGNKTELTIPQDENGYNIYKFSGTEYTRTKSPYPAYGDFRVSFWLHSDDWSQQFGHQVFGNYTSYGLSLTNDQIITPILVFKDTDHIKLTNTNGVQIARVDNIHYTDETAIPETSEVFITREDSLEDITIITSIPGYCLINSHDINGNSVATFTISSQGITGKDKIKSVTQKTVQAEVNGINKSEKFLYTLHEGVSSVCRFSFDTEEYIDLSPNMFEWCTVSGIDGGTIDGYDGIYTRDINITMQNNKPVYTKSYPTPLVMFYDGNQFRITEDVNTYTNGQYEVEGRGGELPTNFVTNTGLTGATEIDYTEGYPKPTYVGVSENDTDWTTIHAPVGLDDLYVVTGEKICTTHQRLQGGSDMMYFVKNNNVYSHDMKFNKYERYVASLVFDGSSVSEINNIKIDSEEHLWIMYDNRFVSRYTPTHDLLFRVDINDYISDSSQKTLTGAMAFDLIREYQQGGIKREYGMILHQDHDSLTPSLTAVDIMNVDMSGDVKMVSSDTANVTSSPSLITSNTNMSNYNYVNRAFYTPNSMFTFKFKAQNKYNANEAVVINYDFPVYKLTPGWHHFCFGFDASNRGAGYFQIDGLYDDGTGKDNPGVVPLLSRDKYGKYGFTEMLSKTTSCGATQGYNDVLLGDYLKQPGYYFTKNMQMKSFRLYNYNLFRINVQSLAREHIDIPDMDWTIPCGRRNHLDHVDKFHKHELPGNKSLDFETHIVNSDIQNTSDAEDVVSDAVNRAKPTHTHNTKYIWSEKQ